MAALMTEAKSSIQIAEAPNFTRKRRSQRIHIAIPIVAQMKNENLLLEEITKTVRVSAHGCLIHLKAQLERGQQILLINPATTESVTCIVSFLGKCDGESTEVGLEFAQAFPLCWRIHFPPEDWNSEDRKLPDAIRVPPPSGSCPGR